MEVAKRFSLVLLLALGAAFGAAQGVGQPVEPATPAPEMAPAPEIPDVAWVRLAHFSPNAPELTVTFTPTDEETAAGFSGDQFPSIDYKTFTEYVEIPAGNYTVSAQGVEGTVEEEFSFARGSYYTLATMGLVLPADVQAEQQQEGEGEDGDGGGFVGFFQNLFGEGDENRDRLALQFQLIEDDLTRVPNEGETLVRVVHAAPGTEPVALAVEGEQGTLVSDVEFGEASRYASYEGTVEDLEVRLAGSRAAAFTLDSVNLESGNLNTVYVVGTPVEEAPLAIMGSSIAPVEAGAPAGEDVAAQTQQAGETAGGGAAEEDAAEGDAAEEEGAEGAAQEGANEEQPAEEPAQPADEGAAGEEQAGEQAGEATEEQPAEEPATEEPAPEEPAEQPATEEPAEQAQ
ncbi:MAG TPA: DUF4397 domain-containing protein [Trueperaceae bacterium]